MEKNNNRILFLDVLRIFAFASVFIGHKFFPLLVQYLEDPNVHETLKTAIRLIIPLCRGGAAGVVVFFLVSGYVVTHVLQKEQSWEFAIKRIFRIYPLYIFALLIQTSMNVVNYGTPISLQTLIPQMLLIGDFFHAPNTLDGVDWTLRVEVLFYLYMGVLRYLNVIGKREELLPWVLLLTSVFLSYMPIMPVDGFTGYVNIYAQFLLMGSFFYLFESKKIKFSLFAASICFMFFTHLKLISAIQPAWQGFNYSFLSLMLFAGLWFYRQKLVPHKLILLVSEMTYCVYLFHNWMYEWIKHLTIFGGMFSRNRYALPLFFLIMAVFVRYVEKPGIRYGRKLVKRVQFNKTSLSDSALEPQS